MEVRHFTKGRPHQPRRPSRLTWLNDAWRHLGSLKLTVAMLALATLLVFVATLDQANYGVRHAQLRYFQAWITPLWLPGGFLLGSILLLNLIAAHFRYFSKKPLQIGMAAIHSGVVLLIISAFVAGITHKEGQLWIHEGQAASVLETPTENELVVIEEAPNTAPILWRASQPIIHEGATLEGLPQKITLLKLLQNAQIGPRDKNTKLIRDSDAIIVNTTGETLVTKQTLKAPQGYLRDSDWVIFEQPKSYRDDKVNALTALVRVEGVGEFAVSNLLGESFMPQRYTVDGKTYTIALRLKRTTLPFALTLNKFSFERYAGSDIPKNFASDVTVSDGPQQRAAHISMNNPLRYGGYTFYQASYDAVSEKSTMLLVAQNPASALPYLAISLMTFGLLWHFIKKFSSRRS